METEKELIDEMEAYPNDLNKYIHQGARDKLMKMGALKKVKEDKYQKEEIKEEIVKPEDTLKKLNYGDAFKKLKSLNMRELGNIAKSKGLSGYSNLRENDLIRLILSNK